MALNLNKLKRLGDAGLVELFEADRKLWTAMAKDAHAYTSKFVRGSGNAVRPDDVVPTLTPALEVSDRLRTYLAERKLIMSETREKFLGNKLVLVAPADSKVSLTIGPNFPLEQALGNGRLAIADPAAVPAGKYGKAALEKLGVWNSVTGKLAPAQDVRAALVLVSRGEAPLGIVYQTDAAADKNVKVIATLPEASHPPIVYPMAILAGSTNGVQYLLSPKAEPFFEKRGFTVF